MGFNFLSRIQKTLKPSTRKDMTVFFYNNQYDDAVRPPLPREPAVGYQSDVKFSPPLPPTPPKDNNSEYRVAPTEPTPFELAKYEYGRIPSGKTVTSMGQQVVEFFTNVANIPAAAAI